MNNATLETNIQVLEAGFPVSGDAFTEADILVELLLSGYPFDRYADMPDEDTVYWIVCPKKNL